LIDEVAVSLVVSISIDDLGEFFYLANDAEDLVNVIDVFVYR
jgi:hypothetical protein